MSEKLLRISKGTFFWIAVCQKSEIFRISHIKVSDVIFRISFEMSEKLFGFVMTLRLRYIRKVEWGLEVQHNLCTETGDTEMRVILVGGRCDRGEGVENENNNDGQHKREKNYVRWNTQPRQMMRKHEIYFIAIGNNSYFICVILKLSGCINT